MTEPQLSPPPLWTIQLIIETADESVVEEMSSRITRAACLIDDADHNCDPPWIVVTSPVDLETQDGWRECLNR